MNFRASLTVDGWVLPISVHDTLKNGKQHDVPLIVGANEGEERLLLTSVPLVANFWDSTAQSDVFVYVFSHLPTGWKNQPCVAFHGLELVYVFGYVPEGLSVPVVQYLASRGGCNPMTPGPDEKDPVVAENTMKMWAQFAKNSNPSVNGLISWPAYTKESKNYLDIGYTLEVKQGVENAYVAPPTN